jgi:hypothetical protein
MNPAESRVKLPAVAMIAVAVVNALAAILVFLGTLVSATRMGERVFDSEAERLGYSVGLALYPLVAAVTVIAAPFIIFGAVHMLYSSNYRLAKVAAILTLIPLTSCCCVLGAPVGIWALVVLRDPAIKQVFAERAAAAPRGPSGPFSPRSPL